MDSNQYLLSEYVADIKAVTQSLSDEEAITKAIVPLAKRFAKSAELKRDEYLVCDEEQGFGVHLLHEEDNHDLGVFVLSWLPNRGTQPHNHKTWAVVAVLEGVEHEVHWQRNDDGSQADYADIVKNTESLMKPGDISVCMSEDIHSVWNTGEQISMSLHTYGKHINFTGRSQFDAENKTETPFRVTVAD